MNTASSPSSTGDAGAASVTSGISVVAPASLDGSPAPGVLFTATYLEAVGNAILQAGNGGFTSVPVTVYPCPGIVKFLVLAALPVLIPDDRGPAAVLGSLPVQHHFPVPGGCCQAQGRRRWGS